MTKITLTAYSFTLPPDDPETWQTRISLPTWEEIGQRLEPPPQAGVLLAFEAKGENPPALTNKELARSQWFANHHEVILEAALQGLLHIYPSLIESFGYDDEERTRWMPDIASIEELKPMVRPTDVTIHEAARDGLPYMGILFDCTWDPEHGTGTLLHGLRVVAAGDADNARDGNIAAEDELLSDDSD